MKVNQLLVFSIIIVLKTQLLLGQIESSALRKIIERARSKFDLPAVVATTMNSDEILLSEIQGVGTYGKDNAVSFDNYFHIGSCSKSVLAIIAAKLVEGGRIKWNTNFFDVYPELLDSALIDYHHITLEDLFLCQAGIKAYTSDDEIFPNLNLNSQNSRYDFAKWLVKQKPSSKFRSGKFEFHYSNAGYTMASLMLERVSGKNYDELIKIHIINEMKIDILIGFPNHIDPKQPWGHTLSNGDIKVFRPENTYTIPELIVPSGNLSMKPLGFAKYIQLNLKGLRGTDNYIGSNSYKYIHFSREGFSLGVFNNKMFGNTFSGMDGSAGTFFCRAILIPDNNFAFTIMTNAGSGKGEMKAVDWITIKIIKRYKNWWWKFWM